MREPPLAEPALLECSARERVSLSNHGNHGGEDGLWAGLWGGRSVVGIFGAKIT